MKSVISATLALATLVSGVVGGALWDYVHKPDSHYSWFDTGVRYNTNGTGWTGYLLNMTSQAWMTPEYSSRYIWTHQLFIAVPDKIDDPTHAAIYLTGGSVGDGPPDETSEDILLPTIVGTTANTICATLFQVPAQPIVWANDPSHDRRGEDAAVAWSWRNMIMEPEQGAEQILYFPMTKSAVRAMDTVVDWAKKNVAGSDIQKFLVTGASKRGWITWLTAATDDRVVAAAPIVMDLGHFQAAVLHMTKAYDGFTFAFKDYCNANITKYLNSPKIDPLAEQIDIVNYKENLTMPKLVIDATGDEFFMPDDSLFWQNENEHMPGETKFLMVSNAEHSFATGVIPLVEGLTAFYISILEKATRPTVSWTIANETGVIDLVTSTKPDRVVMRFADTLDHKRRDFRLVRGNTPADPCEGQGIPVHIFGDACVVPIIWLGEDVGPYKVDKDGYHYRIEANLPADGKWRGFFADMYFPAPRNQTYRFTSQVSIIPQTFPYPPCTGECTCTLV